MEPHDSSNVERTELVLSCANLEADIAFFTEVLGLRLELVFPADDPREATIVGPGLRLRLCRGPDTPGVRLRLACREPERVSPGLTELTAPNGTRVDLVGSEEAPQLPPLRSAFVVSRASDGGSWIQGRAGMLYRDLIPDRQGGRFIASHIRIPHGGVVPDYVHFHRVRFQLIYCLRGWVRVVYEDQGPPFVLRAGDAVLQPPEIRHRVLESGDGLEVLEVSCPAEHTTWREHELLLPNEVLRPERDFGGQRFVHHVCAEAGWVREAATRSEVRELGINAATDGLADVRALRCPRGARLATPSRPGELLFRFVLAGTWRLAREARAALELGPGDACVVPPREAHALESTGDAGELLEVCLPAR